MLMDVEPVWQIRVTHPFKGITPRGIHIGSTEEEVKKAYPDSGSDPSLSRLFQNSSDGNYQIVFDLKTTSLRKFPCIEI